MNALDGIADRHVNFTYCNLATLNKIRAWARRNRATVKSSRYAAECFEGVVRIPSPWNEGAHVAESKRAELRKLVQEWGAHLDNGV